MTECQGCGAWNDASRTLCVLCGAPLAETDEWDAAAEPPPLPPLPDGGLGASMPAWLREPPGAAPVALPLPETAAASSADAAPTLGPRADPRTFLTDDDFPPWLRDLAARRTAAAPPPTRTAGAAALQEPRPPMPPPGEPSSADTATSIAARAEPEPSPVVPAPVVPAGPPPAAAAPPHAERRGREPWETLLLAALLIGVVVAALWALVANGVFGVGP